MTASANPHLPKEWKLPPEIKKRLGIRTGRQRSMAAEGHLLLIVHRVPDMKGSKRRGIFYWRDPGGTWKSSVSSDGLLSLHRLVEDYARTAEKLEDRLDVQAEADELHEILQIATPMTRASRNLHRALQTAREAIDDPEIINLRDLAGEAERTFELTHQEAIIRLQFLLAEKAEKQAEEAAKLNRAGYRLNLLAAFFLPVAAISSIFGMNLPTGFETTIAPASFWIVAGASLFCGWLLFRRALRDHED